MDGNIPGGLPAGLRGNYPAARPDGTVDQRPPTDADHATWRALYARQAALFPGHAARAWREALKQLDCAGGVPDFARASDRLEAATGWRLAAVPGLIPEAPFFDLLARRRFPVTAWIRRPEELDYIVEPDVFHDFLGHVPLLLQPDYAAFLQRYGAVGRDAGGSERLRPLARLYWHLVEFGLIEEEGEIRAFGAGILSSRTETLHATAGGTVRAAEGSAAQAGSGSAAPVEGASAARRLRFDLRRVLRSDYRIDTLQPTFFVIRRFAELFDAIEAAPALLEEALRAPPIPPGGSDPADRPVG
ncbi:hypothetical protein [Roseomonas sp. BN140053]|uniref:hypothetical protein n=1 Tax=Roseomonas sp. BN140053 TaxID=3391898 RepID=UPI0039EC8302